MSLYSKSLVHPPLDGTITIPETIEFHWRHNVDLPAFVFHEEGKATNETRSFNFVGAREIWLHRTCTTPLLKLRLD